MLSKTIGIELFLGVALLSVNSLASDASVKPVIDKIVNYKGTWYIRYQDVILSDSDATEEVYIDNKLDRIVNIGNSAERGFPLASTSYSTEECHEAYIAIYDGSHQLVSKSDKFLFGELSKCEENGTSADTTPPTIYLIGGDETIFLGSNYVDKGATALDNVDGNITDKIEVTSTVNSSVVGDYIVKYNVVDSAGNRAKEIIRNVYVRSNNAPTINRIFNYKGTWYIRYQDVNVHVDNAKETLLINDSLDRVVQSGRDEERGFPLAQNYNEDECNRAIIKIYDGNQNLITQSDTFNFGNLSKCSDSDNIRPIIKLNGGDVTINKGEKYIDAGATAFDNIDGDITDNIVVNNPVDTQKEGRYIITYNVTDSAGNAAIEVVREVKVSSPTNYIPEILTQKEKIKFFLSASFGMNEESDLALTQKGVEGWIDEQFSIPYKPQEHLKRTILLAKESEPAMHPDTLEEYLADNSIVFNQNKASFNVRHYQTSAWFQNALQAPDQLRYRVAYALSQIIVESLAEPFFEERAEGLASYMDILTKNALGNYRDLLIEISHSSSMGLYLTFNGSKKEQVNGTTVIYPDENYARELMQLFTIGLYELNIDGTLKLDANGETIPTYTQQDINALSKVFTGWDLKRNSYYGEVSIVRGDVNHPLEFTSTYHDFGEKRFLGKTIPAGNDGSADIEAAIDILMAHPNIAPFISKQLIMRLVKSNPSPEYVARVASVFNDNGEGVKGDLKAVVKAILLDREFWDETGIVKFKEPLMAYTQFLRAFNVQPLPVWRITPSSTSDVINRIYIEDSTFYLGQAPSRAKSVFNFYDNDYIPNDDEFRKNSIHAPELQIQSNLMLTAFNNKIYRDLFYHEKQDILKRYGTIDDIEKLMKLGYEPAFRQYFNKFLLDCKAEYDVIEKELEGQVDGKFQSFNGVTRSDDTTADENGVTNRDRALLALIEHLDTKLTGNRLSQEEKRVLFESYKNRFYSSSLINEADPQHQIFRYIIVQVIVSIVTSEVYMTR